MKKILFAAIALIIAFASCKKETETKPVKVETKTLDGEDEKGGRDGDGWWE